MLLVYSAVAALVLGFAASRAGICMVASTREILERRRPWMFLAIVSSSLWVLTVLWLLCLWRWQIPVALYQPWAGTVVGALAFGVAASINGGCAISTLVKLTSGQWAFAATVLGWACGMALMAAVDSQQYMPTATVVNAANRYRHSAINALAILGWVVLWAGLWWYGRQKDLRWRGRIAAPVYRPLSIAIIIGLSAGSLTLLYPNWSPSSVLNALVGWTFAQATVPALFQLVAPFMLFAGMVIRHLMDRSFRPRSAGAKGYFKHMAAGTAMGAGAALVPGGNDALLLVGLPTLSPQAVVALPVMMFGMALGIMAQNRWNTRLQDSLSR